VIGFCESIFTEQSEGVIENKGAALKNKAKLAGQKSPEGRGVKAGCEGRQITEEI